MKRMTKPLICMLLAVVLLLAGCNTTNGSDGAESSGTPENTVPVATEPAADPTTEPPAESETEGYTFFDMSEREITLEKPAERVVTLTAADCEIIYALGAGDKLVGRGEYCDYPAEALEVPTVQSGAESNMEEIIALEPDVVIMSTMAQSLEQVEALENAGITVVTTDAQNISDTYTAIELIGAVVGKDDEAGALIADMIGRFDSVIEKAETNAAESEATVYFEVSPLEWGLWTSGKNTFMDEIAVMLGLANAFSDVEGWAEISQEQVIERDPDYIVTVAMYFGDGPLPVDEILARQGWQDMKAVTGGKVFQLDSDSITRPGPRLVSAAESLYDLIYG